ncbi:hypothetical protein BST20_06545 [Mycobacterium branderi]|uniref:Uncharacterized protein n=1 Tax=Mycobacterium branderi TaxID=43348 RepID=A0AA91LZW9_9MYCO|nr:hypothetical protein BST20_06545 [Mycobacterium branderi]
MRWPKAARGRPRVAVIAADLNDVVRSAGGWLFDRTMAGWQVDVAMESMPVDPCPLRILGAHSVHSMSDSAPSDRGTSRALLISTKALHCSVLTLDNLRAALQRGITDITLWGTACEHIDFDFTAVTHQLSSAARAFKFHALAAAGTPVTSVDTTEQLWRPNA